MAGTRKQPPEPRRGVSLTVRIVGSFVFLAVVAGGVVSWGLVRHRKTVGDVRLLDEGYLELALSSAELRATQSILVTLLERILDEEDARMTRNWIEAARRLRPERVERLARILQRTEALADDREDRTELNGLRGQVATLRADLRGAEESLDRFLAAMDARRDAEATDLLADLLQRERAVDRVLRAVGRVADRKVAALARTMERDESRTFWMLLGLALLAAAVAVGILVFVHSTLAALTSLERGVEAVARGDLTGRLDLRRRDEIGRLARQFDSMTAAIRERDERLRALRQSEKLAALGRMAAHVTHEVRNPLSAIGLNVELLEEVIRKGGPRDQDQTLGLLGAVSREVERLTRVTESYLRLARFPQPRTEPVRIDDAVREAAEFHRSVIESRGVRVELDVGPKIPDVAADVDQVRQVLANLLRNALDALRDTPDPAIRLAVRPLRDGVEVSVADNGPGVPDDVRGRLFEPFFTTKPDGTGIGLVASQQVAVAHGGTLTCDDAPGPGACFRLWLPSLPSGDRSAKNSATLDGSDAAGGV